MAEKRTTHPLNVAYTQFDGEIKRALKALEDQFKAVDRLPRIEGEKKVQQLPFNPLGGL